MAYQVKRKAIKNPQNNSAAAKYYIVTDPETIIEIDQLADYIQKTSLVKANDVKAVLNTLNDAVKFYLDSGHKVRLTGLGIFRLAVESSGSDSEAAATLDTVERIKPEFLPDISLRDFAKTVKLELVE
ncbi:MAG: HU family DNA-binding protein [Candidatus Nomurabacteria bacterium]|nr:HU family DNA-binding protein [Candidatus Nomurabacteria bacterium]